MRVEKFVNILQASFFTGVPDSQLKALCNYLMDIYGVDGQHHIIAANEGNCAAIAAGYHLATGNVPVVYMQNSGEGNIINPLASLLNDHVYAIPCIFVVGWRGEPNVPDEPQHVYQGKVTLQLLKDMDVQTCIVGPDTTPEELEQTMLAFRPLLSQGKQVAFVVRKNALKYDGKITYANENTMLRESIIRHITQASGDDPIVSTTGKASRELFEIREAQQQPHDRDFLTVGSMGHASSIALGIALQRPEKKIWIVDGDGAALMHMGAMAILGAYKPANIVHIVINNGAHETVGGQPTVMRNIDLVTVAKGCGYPEALRVDTFDALDQALTAARAQSSLSLIEVRCAIGARENLGRPTTTARKNKEHFMAFLQK
ncbi:MAG: phosphonopyruvate decarboxylase [Clostridia bacterium]|nr:phosphonopyruvate decarboxylase [Clostridia bacterium]